VGNNCVLKTIQNFKKGGLNRKGRGGGEEVILDGLPGICLQCLCQSHIHLYENNNFITVWNLDFKFLHVKISCDDIHDFLFLISLSYNGKCWNTTNNLF